jgi:hypothetical protein
MSFPELSPSQRENILRRNWWGHDGRWFLFVANELGFEKANDMNMEINKAVGKMEIKNLMAISGLTEDSIRSDLLEVLKANLYLCAKDVFDLKEFVEESGSLVMRIERCPAHTGTRKAGYVSDYQCACFKRVEGWIEAAGVGGTALIRKSLMKGDQFCEIAASLDI